MRLTCDANLLVRSALSSRGLAREILDRPADPDDDVVVATAVDGKADGICTLDQHFADPAVVSYCAAHGIRILTDVELVKDLRAASP